MRCCLKTVTYSKKKKCFENYAVLIYLNFHKEKYKTVINKNGCKMKLSERLLIIPLFAVTAIFLVMMVHNKMKYSRLQDEYDTLRKAIDDRNPERPKGGFKILSDLDNIDTKVRNRKNRFKNFENFTLYNPDYRQLTEWPPRFTISPIYPNLAQVLNKKIRSNMSSWERFNLQISKHHVYEDIQIVDELLYDMSTQKIVAVEQYKKSRQLKLLVTFENGGKALLLPKRNPQEKMYADMEFFEHAERHYSEIAAFHLDRILGLQRAPPAVGRKVNISSEIYPLVSPLLRKTFSRSPDGRFCFYGKCREYCDARHPFCGQPDVIEASVSAWMMSKPSYILDLDYIESPWARTEDSYKESWEEDPYYCARKVRFKYPFDDEKRLFDAIDVAILDYLTGNLFRNEYYFHGVFVNETSGAFIHMGNERGFTDPDYDDESILSPLQQCCMIRLSTFNKLYSFHAGPRSLADYMRWSLAKDPLAPILSEPHYRALDRRVDKILDAVTRCVDANFPAAILLDDML